MKPLFIIATNTNVGKTYTTLKLIDEFADARLRPVVFKPIETGVELMPIDALALLKKAQSVNAKLSTLTPYDITSYTFSLPAAPYVADKERKIDILKIKNDFLDLLKFGDIVLIEGAGGLMTPINNKFKMIDLIELFDAHTLLVTSSQLGSINETLLSIEALQNRQLSFDWCVNVFKDIESFDFVTKPYYDKEFPSWWSVQKGLTEFVKNYISMINLI